MNYFKIVAREEYNFQFNVFSKQSKNSIVMADNFVNGFKIFKKAGGDDFSKQNFY